MTVEPVDGPDVVAAAWTDRPGCISLAQADVLLGAAQWAGVSVRDLATTMVTVTGAEDPQDLTPDGWADLMDRFVVAGFRHPLVPTVTAAQLAALDEARRAVGLDGRTFIRLVRQLGHVRSRHRLDGAGFLTIWGWLARRGADVPVPGHGFMSRRLMRMIHEAAYETMTGADRLLEMLAPIGGVLRASQLDRRGFLRVMLVWQHKGAPEPRPAPRVVGGLGMVTQAQVNLIWRGWLDFDGWKGDTTPEALHAAIGSMLGMDGGLASLTRAGARAVIDRFMVPRLNERRAADEAARGRPDDRPRGGQVHDDKQRPSRARRRDRRERR